MSTSLRRASRLAQCLTVLALATVITLALAIAPAADAKGGNGNGNGATQGASPSDPDGDTNGGPDKPGGAGGISDDKDGNNGCGNDDDREDDNNGNCGGNPAKPAQPANAAAQPDRPAKPSTPSRPAQAAKPSKPAQAAKPAQPAKPAPAAKPAKPAQATKPAKPAQATKPAQPAKPAEPAKPASSAGNGPAPQAQAGKITICHATGSSTNPYVRITISVNGLNGHGRHERDIIPAPAGACPSGDAPGDGAAAPGPDVAPATPGKITICHATGSATNPFVAITISVNGLNGHDRHEGDIIPMPATGCPVAASADSPGVTPDVPAAPGKVTICHATGSATNPFVAITISVNGLNGHDRHDGDIIPMPEEGCPVATSVAQPGTTPVDGSTEPGEGGAAGTTDGDAAAGDADAAATAGASGDGAATTGSGDGAVAGASDSPDADRGDGAVAGASDSPDTDGEAVAGVSAIGDDPALPFTGLALGLLLVMGVVATGAGIATRRATRRSARTTRG